MNPSDIKNLHFDMTGGTLGTYLKIMAVLGMGSNFTGVAAHDEAGIRLWTKNSGQNMNREIQHLRTPESGTKSSDN